VQITNDLSNLRLDEIYTQEFHDEIYSWQHQEAGKKIAYDKSNYRLDEIERYVPDRGRLFEIGCSFGFFMDAARSRGWQTTGVEVGEYAAKYAIQTLGLEVTHGTTAAANLPADSFDAVAMWDVLEHLDEPLGEMQLVHSLLKKGGLLVFNTPDVDAYMRRLQGSLWRCFIPPAHIAYFNTKSAERLLERTGFRLLERTFALPRERLLQKLKLLDLFKTLGLSDKMLVFAERL
jgi:2-polyprenyl-3-methyl-5-hydroxy-6-metoxy-1,4-benzoquinol methylase